MPRGQESAFKKQQKLDKERAALDAREAENRKQLAGEAADLIIEAEGYKLDPDQLARIVRLAVKMGDAEAVKRLEAAGA